MNPLILSELKRIARDHGGILKAADVVTEAQSPESPLHGKFEWDDSTAAHQYRLMQARQLIRVSVSYVANTDKSYRVFVSLSPDRSEMDGGYREVEAVLDNPAYRAQLLSDALVEMRRFQEKYGLLQELAEVFEAMRQVRPNQPPSRRSRRSERTIAPPAP